MLMTLARTAAQLRAGAFVLAVAALVVVPPLVLASTQHSASSPRLTRGFEPPPAKCSVACPAAAPRFAVTLQAPTSLAQPLADDRGELIPHLPPDPTVDARRGPPAALHV